MNWYFVFGGAVAMRYEGQPPDNFTHPTKGSVSGLSSLEPGDLVGLGWFVGIPTIEPPFNPDTQKCFIAPQLPAGVDAFLADWKAYKAAMADIQKEIDAGTLKPEDAPWPALPLAPTVLEQWTVAALTDDELAAIRDLAFREVRWRRNMLLQGSDFLMLPDAPIDDTARAAWVAYRAKLRDLLKTVTDPRKVVFPPSPDGSEPAVL
jgi:hypothetical protein